MAIEFFAPGEPKGQPRPRAFARKMGGKYVARVYDCGSSEGWKGQIAIAGRPYIPAQPIDKPVSLTLHFYFPRPNGHYGSRKGQRFLKDSAPVTHTAKPDIDNCFKAVTDALTQLGFWRDDALIVRTDVSKFYETESIRPGARIIIEEAQ